MFPSTEWLLMYCKGSSIRQEPVFRHLRVLRKNPWKLIIWMNELKLHCMLLVSYIQQYFNSFITVLTNWVWKLLIALFKVPNTGAFTVHLLVKKITHASTLSVKRNITSSEWHSLKSKASKLIIFGHRLAIVILSTCTKQLFAWVKKDKMRWNYKRSVFKNSQKLLPSQAGSLPQTKAGMAVTYPTTEIEWIAIECSE